MAPKAKSRSISRPKPRPKAKGKADKAEEPSPAEMLRKEAEEVFLQHEPDQKPDGTLKLAQFAEVVRAMNLRKCMIWGDDPASIIRKEWSTSGGASKRELSLPEFQVWWPNFVEKAESDVAAREKTKEEAAKTKAAKYGHDGVWQIQLTDLEEAINEASKRGKTALIIDNAEDHPAEVFFKYRTAHIIECKKMIMDKARGASVEEILEEERRRFIAGHCFKHGSRAVFRLANTACDLQNTWNGSCFPSLALLDRKQVEKVMGTENAAEASKSPFFQMASNHDERLDLQSFGINEYFETVVITHFSETEYEEYLKDAVPLHLMQAMKPSAP